MRSEDRKPSRRVFPLLQNLDLDSVTFAQVQGVGDPITIEDLNEQEMLDLIIVNLARLCVKSEWTGLLEAGGGGGGSVVLAGTPNTEFAAAYRYQQIGNCQPFGGTTTSYTTTTDYGWQQYPNFMPFVAAASGALTSMSIYSGSSIASCNMRVGIYDLNDDGNPDALLGYGDFDCSSSGVITVTSFSSTITTVRGNVYWLGVVRTSATSSPFLRAYNSDWGAIGEIADIDESKGIMMRNATSNAGVLADPPELSDWATNHIRRLSCALGWE